VSATYLFTGINPRYQWFPWLPDGLNVMYSAAGAWDETAQRFNPRKFMPGTHGRWLDCGGYTVLNRYGDYPWSAAAYANLVAILRPDYYATMDYPCEPDITRALRLATNEERIQATVANAAAFAQEYEPMIDGPQLVPVIQGWTLDEYLYCLHLYQEADMIREYMAVGSMCTRSNDEQLKEIVPALYEAARRAGVFRLHFFGFKMSSVLDGLQPYIYSQDSAAVYIANTRKVKERWGGRYAKTKAHKQEAFDIFFDRARDLRLTISPKDTAVCPCCHSYDIHPPTHSYPAFACAECGNEWGEICN
jgi:hypothetical protein